MIELLHRAWHNECDGWLALGRVPAQRAFRVESTGGIIAAWWVGETGAIDNNIRIGPDTTDSPEMTLAALEPTVAASSSATSLQMPQSAEPQWRRALQACGYRLVEEAPVMVCDPAQAIARLQPSPPEVTVRQVTETEEHRAAFEVVHAVYRGPRALTHFFNPPSPVRTYLALHGETPAAAACLWPFAGVAGIYSVATLPDFRRRGLASAVLATMLAQAAQEGFRVAALRTTNDLIPLYEQQGFWVAGRVLRFHRPK